MSHQPDHAVRCLKGAGSPGVWLINRPNEQPRTLKSWPLTPALLVKLALGIAQPQRQIRGAKRLTRAGIRLAPVIGGWKIVLRHRRPVVELELAYVPGRSALDAAGQKTLAEADRRRAANAIGRVVAQLIDAGLFHRDLKLSNLILDDSTSRVEVWLIDTVGVRPMRRRAAQIARMLERLAVQPAFNRIRLSKAAWMPVMLHALRPLERRTRRAVVRRLKAHRPPQFG